jgi:radical SAM superfamily enzyme YgiQ (UPF0313 family)
MSARVALVRPPVVQRARSLSIYGAMPPIGLAYVAAALRGAGCRPQVIDGAGEALDLVRRLESPVGPLQLVGLNPEEIVDRLDPRTEVIGITHMFLHEWPLVREIAERAKARLPGAAVVLGGENPTAFFDRIFADTDAVDHCVLGEGESTIVELVARLGAGIGPGGMPGVVSRAGVRESRLAERLTRLESIAPPAWDLFPVERYLERCDNYGVNRGRTLPMLATRGCPFQCTFCSSPQMWTTRYSARAPQEVVDELKSYVERYRVENVNFCDLTAVIRRDWILEFCRLLRSNDVEVTWQMPSGTRSEALDEETLLAMYEAGCRNLNYAPESGSERVLELYKKKVKLPRMLDSLKAARRAGVVTGLNIIIGHPVEERRDLWKTLVFLVRAAWIGCEDAAPMMFGPYPGSRDYEALLESGRLKITEEYYYVALLRGGASSKTYNLSIGTAELIAWQWLMLISFYGIAYLSRPWRFLDVLRRALTGKEETKLDQFVRTKLRQLWISMRLRRSPAEAA